MYNFTSFAMTLNELEPGMERLLPPTDCRLRPDIKAMENGDIGSNNLQKKKKGFDSSACFNSCFLYLTDAASNEKERLEEKQRAARRERSNEEEEWTTRCVFSPQIREVLIRVPVILQSYPDSVSRWFQLGTNPHTGAEDWLYRGGYFDRNYTDCPNIYWHRGRHCDTLQWDFTNICDMQTPMPCHCVSGGKTDKIFQVFQIHNCELKCTGDLQEKGEF